ncbi:DNA-binding transcriptional regulator, MocR family / aminotransferase domain [Olavius algarvensis associated proteobacterium Delta 3]|nr:DNA-binding transcriptional regulator, MocR family / aminotransferase domain [Olavius algarvensis associated proteobacterium Delta 3]
MTKEFRYRQLAADMERKILQGVYLPGDRLPSIRSLHRSADLSISTVYKAYVELEHMGLVEARPRSGYYVAPVSLRRLKTPRFPKTDASPRKVRLSSMINSIVSAINDPGLLPLGMTVIDPELVPYKSLGRILSGISRNEFKSMLSYALSEGHPELRRQLARQTLGIIQRITPGDILVTNGCMEAVALALLATTRPGETVAIETPTNYSFLQLLKELNVMVAEVPTDPKTGIDVGALEKTVQKTRIAACLVMPNFHNPLGTVMPAENKKALMRLVETYEIPVIEDDISSELYFGDHRPKPLKAYDRHGLVLTCSSFSKSLAPGLRIGWLMAGPRFKERVQNLKAGTNVSTSALDQYLMAHFLAGGGYDRHLRTLRTTLKKQAVRTALAVQRYFPKGTRLVLPEGGTLLWIQLPQNTDSLELYSRALSSNISVIPGTVCANTGQFRNYIMLSCGIPFTEEIEQGIQTLGDIACELASELE